jgi:PAS domain-containing protein
MKKQRYQPLIIFLLLALGTLFYYFGELVNWAAWDALRLNFFYSIHDVHRLVFLAPIVYAAYTAGKRSALIVTLLSFLIFLPRAFFISPYPDPLLRMVIFVIFAGAVGWLVGALREEVAKSKRLESAMEAQRDRMLKINDNIADGVMITGPDFKIKFINPGMAQEMGEGSGLTCYQYLRHLKEPCHGCGIPSVITDRKTCRWQCQFYDGSSYEITAAPYIDEDGTLYQISVFRDMERQLNA